MATVAVSVIVLCVLLILAIVLIVAAVRPQTSVGGRSDSRLAMVRRGTTRWRWGGTFAGVVLAAAALQLDDALGRGVMLAAPLFSLGVLAGVSAGELRVAAPSATTRSATLEVRRIRDYLPRPLIRFVTAAAGLLAAVLIITTALGSPDDLGHAGRRLVWACSDAITQARSPWPGTFYSVPLAVLVAGGLAAAVFAASRVVRRPRQGEDRGLDDTLRRQAAAAVVAATGILVAVPLAGVGLFTAIALLGISCPPGWMTVLGWAMVLLVPIAIALAVWCTAVLAGPAHADLGRRVR